MTAALWQAKASREGLACSAAGIAPAPARTPAAFCSRIAGARLAHFRDDSSHSPVSRDGARAIEWRLGQRVAESGRHRALVVVGHRDAGARATRRGRTRV